MGKLSITFDETAAQDFQELLGNRTLGNLAQRYLEELYNFPPKDWIDLHIQGLQNHFKSDNHIIFDIQGKTVLNDWGEVRGLRITRFRSRRR